MIIADWFAIGAVAFFCLLGLFIGFGRGLRFFTGGFFGVLIAILVCYCLGGVIYNISFIQTWLSMLNTALEQKGGFCDFLLTIHLDLIVFYVALFIIVMIVRIIIVKIVAGIAEIENVVLKFINKILGAVLFVAFLAVLVLIAFQIIYLIGGNTASATQSFLAGSKLKLDWLYENNPFSTIIKMFVIRVEA